MKEVRHELTGGFDGRPSVTGHGHDCLCAVFLCVCVYEDIVRWQEMDAEQIHGEKKKRSELMAAWIRM